FVNGPSVTLVLCAARAPHTCAPHTYATTHRSNVLCASVRPSVRSFVRSFSGDLPLDSTSRARQWLKLKVIESSCGFLEMSPIGFGVRAREAKLWQKWQFF